MKQEQLLRQLLVGSSAFSAAFLGAATGWAQGYEQSVLWSARYNGTAGAAVSSVKGPQALFFNPAALSSLQGTELSLDGGATMYKNEGPIVTPNQVLTSDSTAPAFGAFLGHAINPRFGIAAGAYTAGQTRSVFENVDLRTVNSQFDVLKPVIQSSLDFTEASVGAAYAVSENFSVGAAWRMMFVRGALSMVTFTPDQASASNVNAIDLQNISATKSGFRVGARYNADDYSWGLGFQWRSQITFNADASANTRTENSTAGSIPSDLGNSSAKVSSIFPQQFALGGHIDAIPRTLRLNAEWEWTNYSVNRAINFTGEVAGSPIPSILQDWRNQQAMRLGAALQAADRLQLRAGYAFCSQVVPDERANVILGAPGPSHTITGGVGTWLSQTWSLDVSGAYTLNSGVVDIVESTAGTSAGSPTQAGNYSSNAIGIFAGVGHRF